MMFKLLLIALVFMISLSLVSGSCLVVSASFCFVFFFGGVDFGL